ncbi:MAG TPA: TlpA disulfide reductase family protein [Rhodocyclaceae bacterium]|nr:TlpA disulfide reductase family protein [Rhodocyclaceae bacterium]
MNRVSRILTFAAVAGIALTAGLLTYQSVQSGKAQAQAVATDAGQAVLSLTLPDTEGSEQALEQWRGNVMVVNFWATWCPPCIKEIPEFAAVSRRHADAPVQFVGISIDSLEKVLEFDAEHQVPYPLLIGTHETLRRFAELGNAPQAMPFTVILDRDGSLRHVKLGTLSEDELEAKIAALLEP